MASRSKQAADEWLKPRPSGELERILTERLDVLTTLCRAYDGGREHFASDIATVLRTLCHTNGDTKQPSLLRQLGRSQVEMLDTVEVANDGDPMISTMPAEGLVNAWVLRLPDGLHQRWLPALNRLWSEKPLHRTSFETWWTSPVVISGKDAFSRCTLVKRLAEHEGGAHVAPRIERAFFALTRGSFDTHRMSQQYGDEPWVEVSSNDAGALFVGAIIRQIAHEVLVTLLDDPSSYLAEIPGLSRDIGLLTFVQLKRVSPRRPGIARITVSAPSSRSER